MIIDVNLAGVMAAAVIGILLAFVWGFIIGFEKAAMRPKGKKIKKNKISKAALAVDFVWFFLLAYTLAVFIKFTGAVTIDQAALIGFFGWLGFWSIKGLSGYVMLKKPIIGYLVASIYSLLMVMIMSVVIFIVG